MRNTKPELQVIAKNLGIRGISRLRKAELIAEIERINPGYLETSSKPSLVHRLSSNLSLPASIATLIGLFIAFVTVQSLNEQNDLARQRLEADEHQYYIETTAQWGELRNTMWEIFDQYPPSGVEAFTTLSKEEKMDWLHNQRILLDSQIGNPVLISDELSLGHWRNAISSVKAAEQIFELTVSSQIAEDNFLISANTILKDVGYVWKRLILDSDQISPTGGRPKEN